MFKRLGQSGFLGAPEVYTLLRGIYRDSFVDMTARNTAVFAVIRNLIPYTAALTHLFRYTAKSSTTFTMRR